MTYGSRRAFMTTLALASAGATMAVRAAHAAAPSKLDTKDPAAVALGYVENTAQVDVKKYPAYAKGSSCENCMQLQGNPGDPYRPCTLFTDKLVAASGWCSGWTAEM